MGALAISDLTPFDGEPRVLDLRLGEALGFDRPRVVRELIERNRSEMLTYGGLPCRAANLGPKGGRPTAEYHLNEAQALLVCMFARTAKAADVRRQVIGVFTTYHHGHLPPHERADFPELAQLFAEKFEQLIAVASRTGMVAVNDPWDTLHRRSNTLSAVMDVGARPADDRARAINHTPAMFGPSGRFSPPKFWSDLPVHAALIELHGTKTLDDVYAELVQRFGQDRTPSRSAIGRFFKRLSTVYGASRRSKGAR